MARVWQARLGTPHDEIIESTNQPMTVVMFDLEDSSRNEYFMIEQQLLVKTNDFRESIFLLIAVLYVFDLEYMTQLLVTLVCV